MRATSPIRAGFIGGGFMAGIHSRACRAAGGLPVAIASSSLESAARAARDHGIARALDVADLLADPTLEVVHICTPNARHGALAMAVLAAGKAVVCEKPLATSVRDAEELVATAAKSGLVAAVPFVYRYHPMVREAQHRVASGITGRIFSFQGSYLQDWMADPAFSNWRAEPAEGGESRAFADIGSHLCDLVEFIIGDSIEAVSAMTGIMAQRPAANEDFAAAMVRFTGGALGTVQVSQVSPGRKNRLHVEISGTSETVVFDQEHPDNLWVGRRDQSLVLQRDSQWLSRGAARLSTVPAGHPMGYQDAFNGFVADAYSAVRGERPEGLPTFEDGLHSVYLTDAVLRSARSGSWVDVDQGSLLMEARR